MIDAPASLPDRVQIVEVGPRDGLQNEPEQITTDVKLAFIRALVHAGLKRIEVTSFVHPRWVPQLSDAEELVQKLPPATSSVEYSALVPNLAGLERALACGIRHIAVFTAASDTFARKNINKTVAESLHEFQRVIARAKQCGLTVRGYVSTSFVCPYEGDVDRNRVRQIASELAAMGAGEISLADTIGAASPRDVQSTVGWVLEALPVDRIALHFHDTYGTALANVYAGLELGINTFDSSAGGLGGCPFAPGASGNIATEDLVYLLDRMNVRSDVKLGEVAKASGIIEQHLRRRLPSRQLARLRGCAALQP